jgi:hypothetical protein
MWAYRTASVRQTLAAILPVFYILRRAGGNMKRLPEINHVDRWNEELIALVYWVHEATDKINEIVDAINGMYPPAEIVHDVIAEGPPADKEVDGQNNSQHTQAASFRDSSGQLFVKNEVGKRKYCPVFEAKSENQQPSA